jgi:two-component system LytT family response regulator
MIKTVPIQIQLKKRITIKLGRNILFLFPEEIQWIESRRAKTLFHTSGGSYLVRKGISRLEQELDPKQFVRISRSTILNIDQVRELRSWFKGDRQAVLHDGTTLLWSRLYVDRLQAFLPEETNA